MTIAATGQRVNEILKLRWDCIDRYGGLVTFWHDQTEIGNYDVAIRIPDRLYDLLAERRRKTLDCFVARHGRWPTGSERDRLALSASKVTPGATPWPRPGGTVMSCLTSVLEEQAQTTHDGAHERWRPGSDRKRLPPASRRKALS